MCAGFEGEYVDMKDSALKDFGPSRSIPWTYKTTITPKLPKRLYVADVSPGVRLAKKKKKVPGY